MSIGPMGIIASAAGTPLAQTKGTDIDKAAQQDAAQSRQNASTDKAEKAAGIATTEEDQQVEDRDADGRRLWEAEAEEKQDQPHSDAEEGSSEESHRSKDPTGDRGNQLDLSG